MHRSTRFQTAVEIAKVVTKMFVNLSRSSSCRAARAAIDVMATASSGGSSDGVFLGGGESRGSTYYGSNGRFGPLPPIAPQSHRISKSRAQVFGTLARA